METNIEAQEICLDALDSATNSPLNNSFNPSIPPDFEIDIDKIKGDAIGDTLYSERYVLSILLRLTTGQIDLSQDEAFEKDLCTLWDMTIERDVVKLLLMHDVLKLFELIIQTTEDKRLTEIIVGIIGNMSCFTETREIICLNDDLMKTVLSLIDSDDALTLIQLMRFFKSSLVFENSGDEIIWFHHFKGIGDFVEKFAFILSNSTSLTLLLNSLEALIAICNKFSVIEIQTELKNSIFQETYVKPCLIYGLIEAFNQTLPESLNNDNIVDATQCPNEKNQKIMNLFLEINVLLCQYEEFSQKCYQPFIDELFECISKILNPLCHPINLFPISSNTQDTIENINEIFQALSDPFNIKCYSKIILIWFNIIKYQEEVCKENDNDEFDLSSDEINTEDICMTILEFVTRTSKNAEQIQIENTLKIIGYECTEKLLSEISIGDSEPDIENCCSKLKSGMKTVWNTK